MCGSIYDWVWIEAGVRNGIALVALRLRHHACGIMFAVLLVIVDPHCAHEHGIYCAPPGHMA